MLFILFGINIKAIQYKANDIPGQFRYQKVQRVNIILTKQEILYFFASLYFRLTLNHLVYELHILIF